MKNQNKTRFEVGMPVIGIMHNATSEGKISEIKPEINSLFVNFNDGFYTDFDLNGMYRKSDNFITLFTLPEYEALKTLTDSFVDGTFAKEQPKFEPQVGEMVLYNNIECEVDGIEKKSGLIVVPNGGLIYTLKLPNCKTTTQTNGSNLQPIEGYQYENGFCIPLLKEEQTDIEQNAQPQPETTDLLDDYGRTVYFELGQEVGCLLHGIGKVSAIVQAGITYPVEVILDNGKDAKYTHDGKYHNHHNNTMLYPIEQYNQIQLPKLKPIQVEKPKEDVISLPSWFKGGAALSSDDAIWHIRTQGKKVEKAFKAIMERLNLISKSCTFYGCVTGVIGTCNPFTALDIQFTHGNVYYSFLMDVNNPDSDNTHLNLSYNKNGKDITEAL